MTQSRLTLSFTPEAPQPYDVEFFRTFEGSNHVQMYKLITGREYGAPIRTDHTRLPISPKRFMQTRLGRVETANAEKHRSFYAHTSTAVIPDPESDAVRFSPENQLIYRLNKNTELEGRNLPITSEQYYKSDGFTLTPEQANALRNNPYDQPILRRHFWEESVAEGDVQLTKDYIDNVEKRTGYKFEKNAMGIFLPSTKGVRLLYVWGVDDYVRSGAIGDDDLGSDDGRLVGEVAEPQVVAKKIGVSLDNLLQGKI